MSIASWFCRDGLLHMETCALIVIVSGLFIPWWWAGVIGIFAGIGKELWDKHHDGVASWHDVFCDLCGVVAGAIITII